MQSIDDILEPYAKLERAIQSLMTEFFSESCGMCTACCCRADICEEVTQSPFLSKLMIKQGLSVTDMDDRIGWMDINGCFLEYGKPPICYEYFCDQLLARLPDDEARYSIQILGKLMDYIGKDAVGSWHLVEIMNVDDLNKISIDVLSKRMDEALVAYEVIEQYASSNRLTAADREALAVIEE